MRIRLLRDNHEATCAERGRAAVVSEASREPEDSTNVQSLLAQAMFAHV